MKYLSFIRHGKAADPLEYENDYERPLVGRGRKDARHIAQALEQIEPAFDWVISSPSKRTRQTAEEIMEATGYKGPVLYPDEIYEGTPERLRCVLSRVPADVNHVLLVGHNTGQEKLIAGLCSGMPTHLQFFFPTCALASLCLEIFSWDQIRWGCAQLHVLLPPKLLRK